MAGSTPQKVNQQPSEKQQMFTEQPIHHQPVSQQASYPPPQYSSSYAPPMAPAIQPIPMAPAIQPTVNVVVNQPTQNPSFQNSKFSYFSKTDWDRAFNRPTGNIYVLLDAWRHGLCDTCGDCGTCVYSYFCPCCVHRDLGVHLGEDPCGFGFFLICAYMFGVRRVKIN